MTETKTEKTYGPPVPLEQLASRAPFQAPAGHVLAFRVCSRDLRSTRGYRWPFPGSWAESTGIPGYAVAGSFKYWPLTDGSGAIFPPPRGPLDDAATYWTTDDECPVLTGDGVCLAKTWAGAASGGTSAGTGVVLLCSYDPKDVLGQSDDKLRVRRAFVLDVLDPLNVLRPGANLRGADFRGANLPSFDFGNTDLCRARFEHADLRGATLFGADLSGARLQGANLSGANLSGAFLLGASFQGANLSGASLSGALTDGINLMGADLTGTTLPDGLLPARNPYLSVGF
jgi:hypothetical protein